MIGGGTYQKRKKLDEINTINHQTYSQSFASLYCIYNTFLYLFVC